MASNDEATNANGGDQPSPDEASDTSTVGEAGRTEPSDPAPEHQEASPQPQPQGAMTDDFHRLWRPG